MLFMKQTNNALPKQPWTLDVMLTEKLNANDNFTNIFLIKLYLKAKRNMEDTESTGSVN